VRARVNPPLSPLIQGGG